MRRYTFTAGLVAVASILTACSSSGQGQNSNTGGGAGTATSDAEVTKAMDFMAKAMSPSGTAKPPPGNNPVVKGKNIWFVTCGTTAICSTEPATIAEAAKAIGWKFTLVNESFTPADLIAGMKQAVAAGADGIFTQAAECSSAKAGYQAAFDAHIPVVQLESTDDCSSTGTALSTVLPGYTQLWQNFGVYRAYDAIAATRGQTQALEVFNPDGSTRGIAAKAFDGEIAKCSGCKVAGVNDAHPSTYTSPGAPSQLVNQLSAEHPNANVMVLDVDSYVGLVAADLRRIKREHPSLTIISGEGLAQAFELIRQGIISSAFVVPQEWQGWAAVDVMNRLFRGSTWAQLPDEGFDLVYVDKTHNLPAANAEFLTSSIDFKDAYKQAWGVN